MANLEFLIYQIQVDGTMNLITRLSCQHQESYELIRNTTYFSQEEDESMETGTQQSYEFPGCKLQDKNCVSPNTAISSILTYFWRIVDAAELSVEFQ